MTSHDGSAISQVRLAGAIPFASRTNGRTNGLTKRLVTAVYLATAPNVRARTEKRDSELAGKHDRTTRPPAWTCADRPDRGDLMADVDCPETRDGLRCRKRRSQMSDGEWLHGGGHMFMSDKTAAGFASGHYDARKALSGEPFSFHLPADCPGPPECFADDSPTPTTSGETAQREDD